MRVIRTPFVTDAAAVLEFEDLIFPPPLAQSFAARLPSVRFATVAAGHDLMITKPHETAQALLSITQEGEVA